MEKTNIPLDKIAHLFKQIERARFLPSGDQTGEEQEMVYAEDAKKWLEEAKQNLWRVWLDGFNSDKMAAAIIRFFGEPEHLCNKPSPEYKLACTLPEGHKGDHAHYPWAWVDESELRSG